MASAAVVESATPSVTDNGGATDKQKKQKHVIGYYTNWSQYRTKDGATLPCMQHYNNSLHRQLHCFPIRWHPSLLARECGCDSVDSHCVCLCESGGHREGSLQPSLERVERQRDDSKTACTRSQAEPRCEDTGCSWRVQQAQAAVCCAIS